MRKCVAVVPDRKLSDGWGPCPCKPLRGEMFCALHHDTFMGVMLGFQNTAKRHDEKASPSGTQRGGKRRRGTKSEDAEKASPNR